jgi:lysophospholipase L1-like esterase
MIINFLGDSITAGGGAKNPDNKYVERVKRALGCTVRNYGEGGTRIARQKVTHYSTAFDRDFQMRAPLMEDDADYVFVFGGTNDYGHGDALLGDINSNDLYTFNGALNNLIMQLKNDYPNKPIIMLTPLHRTNETVKNKLGYTLKDYSDEIIKATQRHNIHLIDLFNEFELNPYDQTLVPDGLHPNDAGHIIMADFIGKKLQEI